jgi:diaminopimelate decarboxylase
MANLAAFPTAEYFTKSGELLVFGNFPVHQLAEIYGTPMFVYGRAALDLKYDAFRSALPERFAIYYCIKVNPSLAVPIAPQAISLHWRPWHSRWNT